MSMQVITSWEWRNWEETPNKMSGNILRDKKRVRNNTHPFLFTPVKTGKKIRPWLFDPIFEYFNFSSVSQLTH